jgi:putative transcription factor
VAIEGTVLAVCTNCAKFGDEVMAPVVRRSSMPPLIAQRLEARTRRQTPRDVYAQTGEPEDLADDFPSRIRRAREARGWKQADLGAKINEKVSVIAKLESGTMTPGDGLVRKLERELGIRLKEKTQPVAVKRPSAGATITVGDLVKFDDAAR